MRTLLLALILAAAASAADVDVSGRWSGVMTMPGPDGQPRDGTAIFLLKQAGTAVTGTAGPTEDHQLPLSEGKVQGPKLSFRVQAESVDFTFVMTVDGDHMKGEGTGTLNDQQLKVKFDLSRAK